MTFKLVVDLLGWFGSFSVVLAYALISLHRLDAKSPLYQILNLAGALCLMLNTVFYTAYPSAFVNLVWLFIALFALFKIGRLKDKKVG